MKLLEKQQTSDINIIFGAIKNENLTDEVIVTVIATGFDEQTGEEALFSDDIPKRRPKPQEVDDEYEIPPFLRSDNY